MVTSEVIRAEFFEWPVDVLLEMFNSLQIRMNRRGS